jgi:3D-(3,5/4)-trihydroxycyclohexane-1,2-dione acylhydrolase (decyclizing)
VITCSQALFQDPAVSFASINVVGRDAIKQAAEPILADARRGLEALSDAASQAGVTKQSDWTDRLQVVKSDWVQTIAPTLEAPASGPLTQGQALAIINDACKPDSYVVSAAGSLPGDINKLWNTCENKRCHLEFGFSCMTYEIPAGIGLVLSGETKHVYVCIGDGTYLMNPSDLITAAREGLKLTVIVFVNHGYQIIRDLQVATTGTGFATEFRRRGNSGQLDGPYLDIDIAKNAASLGATAFSAQDAAGLREALRTAEDTAGVSVIALEVDPHKMSLLPKHGFWDIAPPSVSANETTRERRAQYEEMRKLQRYHL